MKAMLAIMVITFLAAAAAAAMHSTLKLLFEGVYIGMILATAVPVILKGK